jgi:tRNA nucleotidyltransferase (CCA-adding enzyme)
VVVERLAGLPGGPRVLEIGARIPGIHLVGGAVRDLSRGVAPHEIDLAIEGEIEDVVAALGGEGRAYERFATATVTLAAAGPRVDVARTRAETYTAPGALPDVRPAGIDEDLERRDFTVNAIAVSLPDGTVRAAAYALEDLEAGLLRVLHERSFVDDPTRLWRLARYAARLGFAIEERTAVLAREAIDAGALRTVSGTRIGAELRLALAESDPLAALEYVRSFGLASRLEVDRPTTERALELLPADGRADLTVLTVACGGLAPDDLRAWLDDLAFTAADRDAVVAAAQAAPLRDGRASELASALARLPVEAVAVAGARGDGAAARRWLDELRHVRLAITGDDLLAAGVPEGPDIGRRLARTLARKLDGELPGGREAELAAALE